MAETIAPQRKEIASRASFMQFLDIPKSTPDCIIIPSNKYGLGFKRKCYLPEFLENHISKDEFDKVVNHITRLAQIAYSDKRKIDNNQISKMIFIVYGICMFLIVCFFILSYFAATHKISAMRIVSLVVFVIAILICAIVTAAIVFAKMPKYPDLD